MATKTVNQRPLAKKLNKAQLVASRKRDAEIEIKKLNAKIKKLRLPSAKDEFEEVCKALRRDANYKKLLKEVSTLCKKEYPVPTMVNLVFSFDFDMRDLQPSEQDKVLTMFAYSSNVLKSPKYKKAREQAKAAFNELEGRVRAFVKGFLVEFEPQVIKINKTVIDEIIGHEFDIYY